MASVTAHAESGRGRGRAGGARLLVPAGYALLRLRAGWRQTLVAAAGVAIGAAVLALTAVGSTAVQDRAVQEALARLQPSDRAVQAVWSGVPGQSNFTFSQLDRLARTAMRPIFGREPFGVVVFRQATWGGAFVNLGAVDGLGRWLVLHSGRLPRRCTPASCEFVQIGGAPVAPQLPFLHVVGRATLRAGAPLAAYFGAAGAGRPPILLADGVLPFSRTPLPDAGTIARTYGWIVPVAPRAIHDWDLGSLGSRLDRAQSRLEERSDIFTISAPTDTISAIRGTSRVAGERLLILGGDAAVLLLGFAVLASTRLRRDQQAVRRRLTWSGARGSQMLLVAATEVGVLTLLATAAGWIAGTGAGALLARHLGSPGGLVVEHSVFTGRALLVAVALALLTAVVMLAALRAESVAIGGLRLTAADVAALGALAAVLLALARGKADASSLANGGTGIVLLLLPGLVLFVLAVVAARLLGPLLRAVEWAGRRARPSLRVALLSLARAPGEVTLAVVFFVLSIGVALFAISYRATLVRGENEQVRYAVPAPWVLGESFEQLVTVEQAAPASQLARLGAATPALRDPGYVTAGGGRDFTLLALPHAAIAGIDGWRSDFSSKTPAELGRLLRPTVTPRLRGIELPPAATTLTVPLRVDGDRLGLTVEVLDRRGDYTPLGFGEFGRGAHERTVRIPPEARGGRIVALRLSFPVIAAFVAGHRESGTSVSVSDSSKGTLHLGRLQAGGVALAPLTGWIGLGGLGAYDAGAVPYLLNRAADSVLRPREPLDGVPVPVVVSPAIARAAGAGGSVPLHVADHVVQGQIVATARFFPSVEGDLVVADLPTWLEAVNSIEPGVSDPSEIWLDAPPSAAAALARPPFDVLDVQSQRAELASVRDDPLARGSIALLVVIAVVALVLAAVGLVLTVVADRRDDSGSLADLVAQGATPAEVRRHLLLRAGVVGLLGLGGGIGAGAVVGALVVAVVTVTAGAAAAVPPLRLVYDAALVGAALGVLVAVSSAAAALAVRRRA